MLNTNFKNMNKTSRKDKLRNIICAKARNITDENVDSILSAIDIEKQYTITGTNDINILLRNAYIEDGGDVYQVRITPIYGNLVPGSVSATGETVEPAADDVPTAFIKETSIFDGDHNHYQNSVFIYQKREGENA